MKKVKLFAILSPVKKLVSALIRLVVGLVMGLFIGFAVHAQTSNTSTTKVTKSKTVTPDYVFSTVTVISRSTSLVDHQDGTRSDGMDYGFLPSLKTPVGVISSKIIYSQNLNDQSPSASDFSDIPVTFAFNPWKSKISKDSSTSWTPSITAVAPASQASIKKEQLQTILGTALSFGYVPSQTCLNAGYGWNFGASVSFARYFQAYEEDINGAVLNQYSSNQTLNAAYSYNSWSLSLEFIHKNRWTYQNNLKESFEHTEEVGYSVTPHFTVALGHTNAGSALKANGIDSNYELINENSSKIYGQIAVMF